MRGLSLAAALAILALVSQLGRLRWEVLGRWGPREMNAEKLDASICKFGTCRVSLCLRRNTNASLCEID